MISLRQATPDDTDTVENIMEDARGYLKSQGLPQWQGVHGPNRAELERDAQLGYGYVLEIDGEVQGYSALEPGPDDAFKNLRDGVWEGTTEKYVIIHRVMIAKGSRGKKMGTALLNVMTDEARRLGYKDVRIDTHPGNAIMQRVITEAGFKKSGDIMMNMPHGERIAYQKLI